MWWHDIRDLGARVANELANAGGISPDAIIEPGATIDTSAGPVSIGEGTRICAGATLRGPIVIGRNCLIGNQAMVRGPTLIADGVRIGYATELKQALIGARTAIGPMCFVADSRIDEDAYLGAMVRTSNHRLDGKTVSVRMDDVDEDTGIEKLGCWIGAKASLGIQVIVLPGRIIAPGSLFEPRITVSHNHPPGHYRIKQTLETV